MFYLYDAEGRLFSRLILSPPPACIVDARLALQLNGDGAAGVVYYEGDMEEGYVLDGEVVARPANPARLDGLVLRDLPAPCEIGINGQPYKCNEDTAELEFDQPGTYRITVRAWPHLDKEFEIEN